MIRSQVARLIVLCVAALGYALDARGGDIFWYKDLKRATEAAQKADLPIFIDFWADWCGPCRLMDTTVYTNPKVVELFRNRIIGVRLHFDLQPELARQFNVSGLPHLVFTNSYGTSLISHRGFLEAEELAKVVDAMPTLAEINSLDRRLRQNKDDFASLVAMGRALRTSGFFESSNLYYERASRHGGARTDAVMRESILYDMALNSIELSDGKRAADILERCVTEFSASARKPELLLALGSAYAMNGMKEKARRSLNAILSDYPHTAAAVQARALLKSL